MIPLGAKAKAKNRILRYDWYIYMAVFKKV
jgi:hypothetical protein